VIDRRQLHARSRVISSVKTSTLTISLFFALASATACDFGKGDDGTGPAGDDDGADDGVAESSEVSGYADDDDDGADTNATATSGWPGDTSASATSAAESGCDAPHETTDPTFGDTEGWGSSGVADTGYDDGPSTTSGSSSGPITSTSGFDTGVDTDGDSCDVPFAPGNFEYGCLCEDGSCDIYYENVAQIPEFDGYCNCLCQAKGCGEAVGGVAEGGGGEEG
jgi:hypothetical protein